jgi:hypothetical protein
MSTNCKKYNTLLSIEILKYRLKLKHETLKKDQLLKQCAFPNPYFHTKFLVDSDRALEIRALRLLTKYDLYAYTHYTYRPHNADLQKYSLLKLYFLKFKAY